MITPQMCFIYYQMDKMKKISVCTNWIYRHLRDFDKDIVPYIFFYLSIQTAELRYHNKIELMYKKPGAYTTLCKCRKSFLCWQKIVYVLLTRHTWNVIGLNGLSTWVTKVSAHIGLHVFFFSKVWNNLSFPWMHFKYGSLVPKFRNRQQYH